MEVVDAVVEEEEEEGGDMADLGCRTEEGIGGINILQRENWRGTVYILDRRLHEVATEEEEEEVMEVVDMLLHLRNPCKPGDTGVTAMVGIQEVIHLHQIPTQVLRVGMVERHRLRLMVCLVFELGYCTNH
jgi:hypothetical protein